MVAQQHDLEPMSQNLSFSVTDKGATWAGKPSQPVFCGYVL